MNMISLQSILSLSRHYFTSNYLNKFGRVDCDIIICFHIKNKKRIFVPKVFGDKPKLYHNDSVK